MPRRPRRPPPDAAALAVLAPHRVVAVADLVAAGMPPSTIARRVRSGRWQRLGRGVVLLQSGLPSRDQLVEAALVYARPDGVVSGVEAARRHGLRRLPDTEEIHLLVGEGRRLQSSGSFRVERTERLPDPVERDRVPVAPLERAVIDAARYTPDRDEVRAMIAEVVQRRRSTVMRLIAELDAGSQRYSGLPREVLDEARDGMRSASEGWARDVHDGSGLPPVLWNPRLYLPDGRFLASPDGFFDDVALAWEMDSREFHPDGDDATARRAADMTGAGVLVVSHRPRRLITEPARVIEEVWNYYRYAASRVRPEIRAEPAPVAAGTGDLAA